MSSIIYFTEDVDFEFPNEKVINAWVKAIVTSEGYALEHLNFIFCSDAYLLQINTQYLSHDYYTDIITFDSSAVSGVIEGDIFISIERVSENALMLETPFLNELHRVIAHGVLHLLGFDDSTDELKASMRQKEDSYLSLLII